MTDPFDLEVRLCDDAGMISHERTPPNLFDPELTYLKQFRNLQRRTPGCPKLYDGPPFGCTGHAHLAGEHIRCTSPAHILPRTTP